MGPCAVCGGGTIDAAGNCTQCGNYRGTGEVTSAPPAPYPSPGYPQQPQSPPNGYPSPTSGSGYDAYPSPHTSGAPAYPTSGGAGYPASGGGYPNTPPAYQPPSSYPAQPQAYPPVYTPPPSQNKGRRGLNILIGALVSVVLVLLCCIGLTVWSTNQEDTPVADGTPTPTVSVNPDIDSCTVGTWNVTTHTEDLEVPNVGTIKLTGGKGAKIILSEDGAAVFDYGTGTEYTGSVSGQTVRLRIQGEVNYTYTARDARIALTAVDSEATFVIFVNGEQTAEDEEFLATSDTADYTCGDDRLVQSGDLYKIEYTRG
ncbi:hypothetical protein [Catenuloplanes atrovinosus]|uniref:Uncharacterized protein n=1 Tax=Catenuloplanes atrovinosus TaxID=137266 RepID=A0AAE4CCW1_9ACTN|nr:hypothetical protein [Catenuloplanes atrovinosus]MDR7280031.1 hypothetical protein [Catenuloplanes atrovinosus]